MQEPTMPHPTTPEPLKNWVFSLFSILPNRVGIVRRDVINRATNGQINEAGTNGSLRNQTGMKRGAA